MKKSILVENLTPLLVEGYVSIFEDAVKKEPLEYKQIRQFQNFLKQIPRWNDTILNSENTKNIRKNVTKIR